MKRYHLDTNVVLRFLRKDDPEQSPRAAELFAQADQEHCVLSLSRDVIAETVWVMTSQYETERSKIAALLVALVAAPGVECERKDAVLNGLERYGATTLDIVDCLLAAHTVAAGDVLATFDKKIGKKFLDVVLWHREKSQF